MLSELNLVVRSCVSVVSCQPSKDHWQVPWIVVSISWIEVRRCAQPGPRREPPRAAVEVRARCVSGGPGATPGHVVVLTLIPARGAEPSTLRRVSKADDSLSVRQRQTPRDFMKSSDARSSHGAVDRWGFGFLPGPQGAGVGSGSDPPRGPVGSVFAGFGPQLPDSVATQTVSTGSVTTQPLGFRMGELFPFLTLPSPVSSSPSLSATTPEVNHSSSLSLRGQLFPFNGYCQLLPAAGKPRYFQSLRSGLLLREAGWPSVRGWARVLNLLWVLVGAADRWMNFGFRFWMNIWKHKLRHCWNRILSSWRRL